MYRFFLYSLLFFSPLFANAQGECDCRDQVIEIASGLPDGISCFQYVRAYFAKFGNSESGEWVPITQADIDFIASQSDHRIFTEEEGYFLVDCPDEASMVRYGGHGAVVVSGTCLVSKQQGSSTIERHSIQFSNANGYSSSTTFFRYKERNDGLSLDCFPSDFCTREEEEETLCEIHLLGMVSSGNLTAPLRGHQVVPNSLSVIELDQDGVTWTKVGGSGTLAVFNNGQTAHIQLTPNNGINIRLEKDCRVQFTSLSYIEGGKDGPRYEYPLHLLHNWPNPFGEYLHLEWDDGAMTGDWLDLSVIDLSGEVKHQQRVATFDQQLDIITDQLTPGVYFLRAVNEMGTVVLNTKVLKAE